MTYEIITGQFPNDLFISLTGDEYYEYAPSIDTGNCLIFRFVFSAPNDCVLVCNCEPSGQNGFQLTFTGSGLVLRARYNGSDYLMQSGGVSANEYHFCEVLCNMQNGNGYFYVDGEEIGISNAITGIPSVNNNDPVRIGSTFLQSNTGDVVIGLMSFFTGDDLFDDNSDFISQYNDYVLYYKPDKFPDGGPHAEQLIAEESQSYFQSPSGTINLFKEITLNGLTINPEIEFNAGNYTSGDTTVDDFSEAGSGASVVWQQNAEYQSDESVLLPHIQGAPGDYLEKSTEYTGALYDDIVIESVFKVNATVSSSYVMNYGDGLHPVTNKMSLSVVSGNLSFAFNDGTYLGAVTTGNEISINTWHHVMVFLSRATGECSLYIDGSRALTTGSTALDGLQYVSGDNMTLGYEPNSANLGTVNITMFNIYQGYNLLGSVTQYDSFVSSRYSDYQNGGIDIHTPIPITVQCWGDDGGTYPIVATLDKDGVWIQQDIGETVSTQQQLSFTAENGIYGIRLYSKFENQGYTNWDDISANYAQIETIEIERKYERVVKRIIAQTKPMSTWALLLIKWV